MVENGQLARGLLALRLGVFLVMFMWALDKLVNPQHAAGVYEHFYRLYLSSATFMRLVGVAEMAFLAAFVVGLWKRWTYGGVLLLHAVSTFSSYRQYLTPWESAHLLFFWSLGRSARRTRVWSSSSSVFWTFVSVPRAIPSR